jgi:hypothetical protein
MTKNGSYHGLGSRRSRTLSRSQKAAESGIGPYSKSAAPRNAALLGPSKAAAMMLVRPPPPPPPPPRHSTTLLSSKSFAAAPLTPPKFYAAVSMPPPKFCAALASPKSPPVQATASSIASPESSAKASMASPKSPPVQATASSIASPYSTGVTSVQIHPHHALARIVLTSETLARTFVVDEPHALNAMRFEVDASNPHVAFVQWEGTTVPFDVQSLTDLIVQWVDN